MSEELLGLSILREVGSLQDNYAKLVKQGRITKKAICDLVIPFRDKYGLSDLEALSIARNEMCISSIAEVLRKGLQVKINKLGNIG